MEPHRANGSPHWQAGRLLNWPTSADARLSVDLPDRYARIAMNEPRTQFQLLFTRRLGPLFTTQFFGAFNDNLFKAALTVLFVYGSLVAAEHRDLAVNAAAGLFVLPFFLFSANGGADRRQVREIAHRPPGEACRDRRRPHGGRGAVPPELDADARGAVPAGVPVRLLRAIEVLDPAPAPRRDGTRRRQRRGGDGHLRVHPARHHSGYADRRRRSRLGLALRACAGRRRDRLSREPAHPRGAGQRSRRAGALEPVHGDLADHRACPATEERLPFHSGHLLVLADRCGLHRADSQPDPGTPGRGAQR